jgi:dolichyl-phosphate-mannose-protein mannosyltransferase
MFYQNEPFPQAQPPELAKYRTPIFLTIIFLSFFTRYYLINHPAQVSFDEVHFGHFANNYIDGKYFFDIHPPLGTTSRPNLFFFTCATSADFSLFAGD